MNDNECFIYRCRESCVLAESTASSVTGLEEELMVTKVVFFTISFYN